MRMGLKIDSLEKRNEVFELVEDTKKAKINWVMTVTQLSFDELEIIANDLGLVIKGEFIALPEYAHKLPEDKVEKLRKIPTYSREELATYNLLYCPRCAIMLEDVKEKADMVGFCHNCGLNFKEIFRMEKMDGYFQKRCLNCGTINPVKVRFCFKCGSNKLERMVPRSKTARKINPRRGQLRKEAVGIFIISFIFAVGMIVWSAIEIFQPMGIMTQGVAIAVIVIGSILLAVPCYYMFQFRMWREYQRYKWYFDDD